MANTNKIFDDFPNSECNNCTHYWDNKCDANMLLQGSKFACKSFSPTRGIIIPQEIEKLKRKQKWTLYLVILSLILNIMTVIVKFAQ